MNVTQRQTAAVGDLPDSASVEISALLRLSGDAGPGLGAVDLPHAQKNCLRRCASHKANTARYVHWIGENQSLHKGDAVFNPVKLQRLSACGSFLQFRQYHTLTPPKTVLSNSGACKQHLHCPLCAIRRAAKTVRKFDEKCKALLKDNPNLELHFAVLTIENEADFDTAFDCVTQAVRDMFVNRRFNRYARDGVKRYVSFLDLDAALIDVVAGAYSVEVKRGTGSGKWHPHINLLLLIERTPEHDRKTGNWKLDYEKLRNEWEKLTGGKGKNVEIRLVTDFQEDKTVFVEIFKYAMKFSEMAFPDRYKAATALYRRNLSGSFGAFRGLDVDKDDTLEYADLPYLLLIYRYDARRTEYFLDRIEAKVPCKNETWGNIIPNIAQALQEGGLCCGE